MISLRSSASVLVWLALSAGCGGGEKKPAEAPSPTPAAPAEPNGSANPTGSTEQTGSAEPTTPPTASVVGGYTAKDPSSAEIQTVAAKAVPLLQSKLGDPSLALVKVVSAATQVVAGRNVKMTLELSSKAGAKKVEVVVYEDLKGNHSLTSVTAVP